MGGPPVYPGPRGCPVLPLLPTVELLSQGVASMRRTGPEGRPWRILKRSVNLRTKGERVSMRTSMRDGGLFWENGGPLREGGGGKRPASTAA